MIPIRDENPTRRTPVVTVALITANCLIFLYQMMMSPEQTGEFIYAFGAIPRQITTSVGVTVLPWSWLTVLTSMFLHGSLLHLGGNMLYLWIFGNNIEDRLGHLPFLGFYLLGGAAAALTHIMAEPASTVPMVGASGAISAVLGAYMIVYPRAKVVTMVIFFIFIRFIRIPAFIVLGVWFVMQISGVLGTPDAGIAWYAHIGGFIAGIILIIFSGKKHKRQPRWS